MKNKKMKGKILGHVASVSSLLIGTNIVHVAGNHEGDYLKFFNLYVDKTVAFDTGLLLMGVGFFIEFCLSFKPLEVKD